jgi:hypothetical protein
VCSPGRSTGAPLARALAVPPAKQGIGQPNLRVHASQGQLLDRAQLAPAELASARSGDGRYPLTVR